MANVKKRLDVLLVERGLAESRQRAQAVIMSGQVYVREQKVDKAGTQVEENAPIEVRGQALAYVSRGGLKLEKALKTFSGIRLKGVHAIDAGASTGGFTDCMLQNGAEKVYAVDVGYGQLAWSLRSDPRVVCMERTNVRYLTAEQIPEPLDFGTVDVSFISLKLILPALRGILKPDGTEVRPIVTLCGNFTKPTSSTPSLLTFDEFETFLHEFGHCLHGLFAEGKYASLTGTSVYQDFVELPSQIMENWATQKEFLDLFAVHYKSGEKMPQELIDKIVASKNYLAAYANVRQLGFAMNDMAWHTVTEPVTVSVEEFERTATAPAQITPYISGTAMSPAFSHIFGGGYAAGYYGYKWAEVLEADAFSLFEEQGIFNRDVAGSFRENILSKGGSEHPMTLYVRFRGHKPETKALIDKILE